MALVLEYMDKVNKFLNKYEDSRTANYFLMSSPFYTLGICLSYVYIVKVLGPKLMENRKPFQMKRTLVIYNFLQVVFSTYLFLEIGMSGWLTGEYSWKCQPVDYSMKPSTLRMVDASWWYYFSKFTEFFDTIFFVLRKKFDHITTLHVIHHGIMPMSVWFGVKFTPGGHSTFFGFLNTFVHIVMYTYYMLSAFGPQMQKYLWWKKYLTTLQMVQFVGIMVHAFQLLFIDCNYPRAFVWWIGMHAVMFFFLFKDFYNNTYNRRGKGKAKVVSDTTTNGAQHKDHQLDSKQNGTAKSGTAASECYQNGELHAQQHGVSKPNGYIKENCIFENGVKAKSVSDYYMNGTTSIAQRYKSQ